VNRLHALSSRYNSSPTPKIRSASMAFDPPQGIPVVSTEGERLLRIWPTVLWHQGPSRSVGLIGVNEDPNDTRNLYHTRRIQASQSSGRDYLIIEAARVDLPFNFIECGPSGGPIALRRGDVPGAVMLNATSSEMIRYLLIEAQQSRLGMQ
jgi:hypothetical protein